MTLLREHLDLFVLALHRATVLRVGGTAPAGEEAERASDAHLPGAGWVVGIVACLAFALPGLALRGSPAGAAVAAVVATIAMVLLTRGRGETALFRTAERLQPGTEPGPSGAGTLALVLLVAARLALLTVLATLSETAVIASLFAAQVVSRLAPLLLARSLQGEVRPRAVQVGAAWCLLPLLLLLAADGPVALVLAVLAATLACYGLWRLARGQPQPADRDWPASAQPVCEVAFYLGAALGL